MALAMSGKGSLSIAKYLAKMQVLANDMAAAEKALDDEDLVQYILSGLDEDYDSMVNSVLAQSIPITVDSHSKPMLICGATAAPARLRTLPSAIEAALAEDVVKEADH
jgi:hypothetical protein